MNSLKDSDVTCCELGHFGYWRSWQRDCSAVLSHLSSSWLNGEVPVDWRLPNVVLKGQKEDAGNYRSLSLILVPSKFMEQIIWSVIIQHTQDSQGIRPNQHGSRKGRSCLANTNWEVFKKLLNMELCSNWQGCDHSLDPMISEVCSSIKDSVIL